MCTFVSVYLQLERVWCINLEHLTSPLAISDLFSFNLFYWGHDSFFLAKSQNLILSNNLFLYHSTHLNSTVSWYSLITFSLCAVYPLLHLMAYEEVYTVIKKKKNKTVKNPTLFSFTKWRKSVQHSGCSSCDLGAPRRNLSQPDSSQNFCWAV